MKIEDELLPKVIELCIKEGVDITNFSLLKSKINETSVILEKIHKCCN